MGGMGLVEWMTHNVTPELERASTECMYYLLLPLGGALLMHVIRCVSSSVPSLYVRPAVLCLHVLYSGTMQCTFLLPPFCFLALLCFTPEMKLKLTCSSLTLPGFNSFLFSTQV